MPSGTRTVETAARENGRRGRGDIRVSGVSGSVHYSHTPGGPRNVGARAESSNLLEEMNENKDLVADREGFEPSVPDKGTAD